MHITTSAIVLRERAIDEYDSILTLLTDERGVITAYARGVKRPRSTMRAAAELLSYSCFVLFSAKERYAVDKADLQRLFMGVRGDVEKLSLASYFCQLTAEAAPHEESAVEYLRLLLNTLYLLDQGKRTCAQLKPIYELRLLTMAGFMPDLVACRHCGAYEAETMIFLPLSSGIVCDHCTDLLPKNELQIPLSKGVLAAMRHILYAENEKLFQFTLSAPGLRALGEAAQGYVMTQLEKRFDTLDFYETICRETL